MYLLKNILIGRLKSLSRKRINVRKKKQREKLLKNIGSTGTNAKKRSTNAIEFICRTCKEREEIPKEIVKHFDSMDGGDPMDPPRFSCERCGNEMVPVYYKSVHGIIYDYSELKK